MDKVWGRALFLTFQVEEIDIEGIHILALPFPL